MFENGPAAPSARIVKGAATLTVSSSVSVTFQVAINFWHMWTRMAVRSAKEATVWRAEADAAPGEKAVYLTREFDAAMVAVAACGFALDAFYASLAVPRAARSTVRATLGKSAARHTVARLTLQSCFQTDHATRVQWSRDIPWLFALRDKTVHPEQLFEDPLPLPDGTMSTARREHYTAASAARAVNVLLGVLEFCANHPGNTYPEPGQWADSGRNGGVEPLLEWWHATGWHPLDSISNTKP